MSRGEIRMTETLFVTNVEADLDRRVGWAGGSKPVVLGYQITAEAAGTRRSVVLEFDDPTCTFNVGDEIEMTITRKAEAG